MGRLKVKGRRAIRKVVKQARRWRPGRQGP
jgi:hypothetical protein